MARDKELPEIYTDAMRIHGKGHGFYEPEDSRDVRPGACGYINTSGQWQPIVAITDKEALSKGGYKPVGPLVKARSSEFVWQDITSEGVINNKGSFDIGADGSAAAVPVAGSMTFSLESSVQSGAVLLCNTSVHRKGFAHEGPLRDWGKANANAILRNCKDARDRGFWVVKTTWTTADVWTNAWKDSQKQVSIGFRARAVAAGELAPHIEWSNAESGGGWIHPIPTNGEVERRVVFFTGVRFNVHRILWSAMITAGVRGPESLFISDPKDDHKPEQERAYYQVECIMEGEEDEEEEEEEEEEGEDEEGDKQDK